MNDDTRLDARVRSALTELAVPDDHDTRLALRTVLERSRGPRRTSRSWAVPAIAAAAVAILVLVLTIVVDRPGERSPTPAPAPGAALTGAWKHEVTGASEVGWDGSWTFVLEPGGVLRLTGPATVTESTDGASYEVTPDHLRVDVFVNGACPEIPAGVYTWQVSGDRLTLDEVSEECAARAELFLGSWTRVE